MERHKFAHVKEYCNERGIIVKPLLIMRDPFERIWSEVRMRIGNRYPEQYRKNLPFINKKVLETYSLKAVERKTRYEHMIENLEHVFDEHEICYEFSEQLFTQEGFDRVTNHLGIPNLIVDVNSPNLLPKLTAIPIQIKRKIIGFYKVTYLSISDKFGANVENL